MSLPVQLVAFSNAVVLILLPYWVAPYLIAAGYTTSPPIPVMGFAVMLHTLGVAIMMVSGKNRVIVLLQMHRSTTHFSTRRD